MEGEYNMDPNNFEGLYRDYFTPVYRYLFLRVKNKEEAEDMAQDVFLKAYNSLGHFHQQEDKSPLAYFFVVARNTLNDYWRKQGRVAVVDEEILATNPDPAPTSSEKFEKKEFLDLVREGLSKMSEEQAELIVLKFIQELSNKEIAEITGKKEESIRQTQHRALERLKEFLKQKGYEY